MDCQSRIQEYFIHHYFTLVTNGWNVVAITSKLPEAITISPA